ncbi:MAG TPA: hypothetical protein PLD23_12155 [Armatimonadota bacterium]|nr:hypothetical protein [Armatimonadota bacterium]
MGHRPARRLGVSLDSADYIIVQAVDAHGDNTLDGNRTHTNWPALPRAVRIETQVTEVWPPPAAGGPEAGGHVYISDTLSQFRNTPILFRRPLGDAVRCQTVDHQANIEALVELRITNTDQSTSTNATCGGMQVYFRSLDPDSGTLWDTTPGLAGDDNVDTSVGEGRGTLAPQVSAAAANQSGDFPARTAAVATTTLTFTDHQAGDNYVVEASTCDLAVTEPPWVASGVLDAWKLIWYERDRMFKEGSFLSAAAAAGATTVTVEAADPAWVGRTAAVFDPDWQDINDTHLVTNVAGNTVTLDPPLTHNCRADGVGALGIIRTVGDSRCDALETMLLPRSFGPGEAFVEWRERPAPEHDSGLYPYFPVADVEAPWPPYFRYAGEPNTVHFIDGHHCTAAGYEGRVGLAGGFEVMMFQYASGDEAMTLDRTQLAEQLVHEFGHMFGLADFNFDGGGGHPDHLNHASTDGCIMLYTIAGAPFNPTYPHTTGSASALFGGPTSPPAEPVDLILVAGRAEPLPGAPGG